MNLLNAIPSRYAEKRKFLGNNRGWKTPPVCTGSDMEDEKDTAVLADPETRDYFFFWLFSYKFNNLLEYAMLFYSNSLHWSDERIQCG